MDKELYDRIDSVAATIRADPHQQWHLQLAANIAECRPFRLSRAFKDRFGDGFYEYVDLHRVVPNFIDRSPP